VGSSHIAVLGMKKFQCLILCMLLLIDDASDAMSNSNLLKTKSCFTEQKATAMLKRRRSVPRMRPAYKSVGKCLIAVILDCINLLAGKSAQGIERGSVSPRRGIF